MKRSWIRSAVAASIVLCSATAFASSEGLSFDAESFGIAGTGTATAQGAHAMVHNPALLNASENGDVVLDGILVNQTLSAPILGPNGQLDSKGSLIAGFVGASVRVMPRLVLGISVSPGGGSGGDYTLPGGAGELSAQLFSLEAALGASFKVTEDLWVGAEYRFSYLSEGLNQPTPTPAGVVQTKLSASGVAPFAGSLGLFWRPAHSTGIGLYYRSRVSADVSGTLDAGPLSVGAHSHVATPDKLALGISQELLDARLRLTVQGAIAFYGALDGSTTTTFDGGVLPPLTQTLDQRNIWEAKAGGEYWAVKGVFVIRAGIFVGDEQTRAGYENPFSPPATPFVAPTLGAGLKLGHVDINLGVAALLPHSEQVASTVNGFPGEYKASSIDGALGVRYRF